ncbi:uncharacterized protein LOC134459104 [Engraulis encrasicolus]|uniref:uncharacterized protein LOC134459104 n=1 Tax=Engraulis encrasicolus TaxID=184585 RepID=UPI002FD34450
MTTVLLSVVSLVYLGTMSAAAITSLVEDVNIGDPAILSCTIKDKVNVDSSNVEWKIYDQTVAKYSNGNFMSYCGFNGRVDIPRQNIEMGNLSLFMTYTVYNDYGVYECYFNGIHQLDVTLRIKATIPKELIVEAGCSIWIPCYTRREMRCVEGQRAVDAISFNWTKDNQNVFQMVKGGRRRQGASEKERVGVLSDIDNGNLSLAFPEAYFSDHGTYRCSEQKNATVLKIRDHKKEIEVTLEEPILALHLYTVDPADLFFQRDNSSIPVPVCNNYYDKCNQNWRYIDKGHKVELDTVTRDHLGIYTVRDKHSNKTLCSYIVRMAAPNRRQTTKVEKSQNLERKEYHMDVKVSVIIFFVLLFFCFGMYTSCMNYHERKRGSK